ncbi:putative transcriptional regulatory protein [Burkholderiales bacterium 8X]|nr:putative transcriptional regulatory protein [Burkholderiales bacterium 8X]
MLTNVGGDATYVNIWPSMKTPAPLPTPALNIGPRLRSLRRAREMTVEEFALAVDVNKAHVSRIERGLKTPSIGAIARMAKVLGVTIGHLVGETLDKGDIKVIRGSELGAPLEAEEPARHGFIPLLHGQSARDFEAFMLYPSSAGGAVDAHHDGQEMIYVLGGAVEVIFADHVERLEAGDCIHFPGYLSHRIRRVGRGKARALLVLSAG